MCLKYFTKGVPYKFENYKARRALAAMDWNENEGAHVGRKTKTYHFIDTILNQFAGVCQQHHTGAPKKT